MPRVISGKVGGLQLKTVTGLNTRPSADRTKEGMFSAITARMSLAGAEVLDLFAGSGQLGIEALSRGAKSVVFVEAQRRAVEVIKANLIHCGLLEDAQILVGDAIRHAQQLSEAGASFDLILMDPPYVEAEIQFAKLAAIIKNSGLLRENGLLVCESAAKGQESWQNTHLTAEKSCQYGAAMVSFYRNPDTSES